jgi:hypothetical protein
VRRPDGRWVNFNAYACQGKPEGMDEIVFTTTTQIMETFGKLIGRPKLSTCRSTKRDLEHCWSARKVAIRWEAAHERAKAYYERRQKKRSQLK